MDAERRSEDRWRGSIDARVAALEREIAEALSAITEYRGEMIALKTDFASMTRSLERIAIQIERSHEQYVAQLKETVAELKTSHAQAQVDHKQDARDRGMWATSWKQIAAAGFFALVASTVPAIITLAITGRL